MNHREAWSVYLPLSSPVLETPPWSLSSSTLGLRTLAAAAVIVSLATSTQMLGLLVSEDNDMLAFLGAVIGVSLFWGQIPAWVSCLLSLSFLSFGHGHSGFSLSANGVQVFLSSGLFLFTTHQVARLADRTRAESWRSRQRAQVMEWLQKFSADCSRQTDPSKIKSLLENFDVDVLGSELPKDASTVPREKAFWREVYGDLSEIAEAALRRIEQTDIKERAAVLEATRQLQATLIDSLSHDLQTPLSALSGAIEMLRDAETRLTAEAREELLELGFSQTNRLMSLVRNILNLAKLQGGGLKLSSKPLQLTTLAPRVVEQLDPRYRCRVRLIQDSLDSETLISGDRTLLTQVLWNLVDNALKFSPEESEVVMEIVELEKDIVVEVSDRGFGIEPHEQQKIFERFFRGTTLQKVPGSGLGLYLCSELVFLHGGSLEVRSQLGSGSTFTLRLPKLTVEEMEK